MDYAGAVAGDNTSKRVLIFLCVLGWLTMGLWRCTTDPILISLPATWPTLTAGAVTNGQIPLTLIGEASVQYVIESSPDLLNWSPVATNSDNNSTRQLALPAVTAATFYRASRKPIPLFNYALAAQGNIDLMGSGLIASSWNSYDPNQSTNGAYNGYTGINGDIASVAGIVDLSNHTVDGSLFLGPTASFSGSGYVTGSISINTNLVFPDVSLPNVTWLPAPLTNGICAFTTNGFYNITNNNPISVEPGIVATLSVTSATTFSPSSITIKGGTTNSGTLIIYQSRGSFSFTGGPLTGRPQNFIYLGLPGVTSLNILTAANFVGLIYAPEAVVPFQSGASSYYFIGSYVVGNATLNGHCTFHFDESLRTNGPVR
jgi:hypothetical protein